MQLEYADGGVSNYRDILYTKDAAGNGYFKELTMGSAYTRDHLDYETKTLLLQEIGKQGRQLAAVPLPL